MNIYDVIKVAVEAGRGIMDIYERTFSVDYKEDRTPLTEADRRSHKIIVKGLESITPHIPVLSEEGKDIDYAERKNWKRLWLVDPLDGTKEFIKRNGEFTVNIALVEEGTPVLGVVYAPALGLIYLAQKEEGACRIDLNNGNLTDDTFNKAQKLPLEEQVPKETVRVVVSRSHLNRETEKFLRGLEEKGADIETVSIGSSLKFCLVAEGKADIYPRLGPTMEWDTAAAHVIATESGCKVKTLEGEDLSYNKGSLANPHFVVFRKEFEYLVS